MIGEDMVHRQTLHIATIAVALAACLALCLSLYGVVTSAVRSQMSGQTDASASVTALALANAIRQDARLVDAVSGEEGTLALLQGTASRVVTNALEYANINVQRANPQVQAFYYYDKGGAYLLAQTLNPDHRPPHRLSVSCDSTNTYCIDMNAPASGYLHSAHWRMMLTRTVGIGGHPQVVLAFDRQGNPYGSLYLSQPVRSQDGAVAGALVEVVDASTVFAPYTQERENGNLVVAGGVLIDSQIVAYHDRGQLPIVAGAAGVDPALSGGLAAVPTGTIPPGPGTQFTLHGRAVLGSPVSLDLGGLTVVSYTGANALAASTAHLLLTATPLIILIGLCVGWPLYARTRQRQRQQRFQAALIRAKAEAMAGDIVAVSDALREDGRNRRVEIIGDGVVVRQLSQSLNALFGRITESIAGASYAVQVGAARVDESVRRMTEVATGQHSTVDSVATGMERVLAAAAATQHASVAAAASAVAGQRAVIDGRQAAEGISQSVDAIKEAAVAAGREFRRLHEDSIRLTALVASVKSTAESLDRMGEHATIEARALGTATAAATATNIVRLARQAQDTLMNTEAAVRSVVSSIEGVNRRMDGIGEWVRKGVAEVGIVQGTFSDMVLTNSRLARHVQSVESAAAGQVLAARQTAHALAVMEEAFKEFTAHAVASSTELGIMQSVVTGLQRTIAELKNEQLQLLDRS